jgi:ATP-grasp domain
MILWDGCVPRLAMQELRSRMKKDGRPVVLIAATMWWPLSARLAMAFIHHGCRVSAVCPDGHPLRYVENIESVYPYRGFNSIGALKAAIVATQPDIVAPADDGAVWQLHQIHADYAELRPLIECSLGEAQMYSAIRSRAEVLRIAAELGLRTPASLGVTSEDDAGGVGETSAVLKVDGSCGGTGVEIVSSAAEARSAFRRLSKRPGAGFTFKRMLVNRDPLALWWWRNKEQPHVSVQQFIPGRPANTMFASWGGEVLGIVTVEVLCAQGTTGAANVVRLVRNSEIDAAVHLLARRFKLNGFCGLDFILQQGTGDPYLIELNPRCTQLGHLSLPDQGDLAGLLSARLQGRTPQPPRDAIGNDTIAFFPQATNWAPMSPYLARGHHDVPSTEPKLVRHLLKEQWPDRQLPARLYHFFRRPKRAEEVTFEEALVDRLTQV